MKFKGKSFIAIVLSPEPPFSDWLGEIDRIIARSPGFFIDRPIILDVRGSKIAIEDLEQLLEELGTRSVRVMGIDGVSGTRLKPGMPPSFSGGRLASDIDVPTPSTNSPGAETAETQAKAPKAARAEEKPTRKHRLRRGRKATRARRVMTSRRRPPALSAARRS